MKKCDACGLQIDDDLTRCPYCGAEVSVEPIKEEPIKEEEVKTEEDNQTSFFYYEQPASQPVIDDVKVSNGWLVAGILVPIMGLIFAFTFGRNNLSIRRKCLRGFLIGILLTIVLDIIANLIMMYFYQNGYFDDIINQYNLIKLFII